MEKLPKTTLVAFLRKTDKTIGRVVKVSRIEAGLKQDELAEKMGWAHRNTVSQVESGKRPLTVAEMHWMARVFKIRAVSFLKRIEAW